MIHTNAKMLIMLGTLLATVCSPIVNRMSFFPDTVDIHYKLPDTIQETTIASANAVDLHALYIPSPNAKTMLIYFHGNAGNVFHRIPSLTALNHMGVSVLAIDYRGYGKSSGKPSEKGIYQDGLAAIRYAHKTLGFAHSDIIVFGRSIGTTVACYVSSKIKLKGTILVTPITSARDHAFMHGMGPIAIFAGNAFDNVSKAKHLRSPALVVHGTRDEILPYKMGKKVFAAITQSKEFVSIQNGSHNDLELVDSTQYWDSIASFIKTCD